MLKGERLRQAAKAFPFVGLKIRDAVARLRGPSIGQDENERLYRRALADVMARLPPESILTEDRVYRAFQLAGPAIEKAKRQKGVRFSR